jgi:hypothetical protein
MGCFATTELVAPLACYFEVRHQFNRVGKFHEAPCQQPDLSGNLLSTMLSQDNLDVAASIFLFASSITD